MKLSMVLVAASLAFTSCNCFKKMAKNREDVQLTVAPEILTLNNGIVAADINATFPVKYFNAKAVVKVTPVIVFEGGEVAAAPHFFQASRAAPPPWAPSRLLPKTNISPGFSSVMRGDVILVSIILFVFGYETKIGKPSEVQKRKNIVFIFVCRGAACFI